MDFLIQTDTISMDLSILYFKGTQVGILNLYFFLIIHLSKEERAQFLALLYVMFTCEFVTFPYGILGQVWYLIVSIPDLCLLPTLLTLANSVDPNEMQHYAAFHLGLHCLPKYSFRGLVYKGLNVYSHFKCTKYETCAILQRFQALR